MKLLYDPHGFSLTIISEYLFVHLGHKSEGDFAKIKSFVVSENSLATIAKKIRVDNFILIGKGEEYSGGRNKKAILICWYR